MMTFSSLQFVYAQENVVQNWNFQEDSDNDGQGDYWTSLCSPSVFSWSIVYGVQYVKCDSVYCYSGSLVQYFPDSIMPGTYMLEFDTYCSRILWPFVVLHDYKLSFIGTVVPSTWQHYEITFTSLAWISGVGFLAESAISQIKMDNVKLYLLYGVGCEKQKVKQLKFYPNPVTDYVNIYSYENKRISIYDVSGTNFGHFDLLNGQNKINMSFLPSGIYILDGQKVLKK